MARLEPAIAVALVARPEYVDETNPRGEVVQVSIPHEAQPSICSTWPGPFLRMEYAESLEQKLGYVNRIHRMREMARKVTEAEVGKFGLTIDQIERGLALRFQVATNHLQEADLGDEDRALLRELDGRDVTALLIHMVREARGTRSGATAHE